jgi:hypothetical protein
MTKRDINPHWQFDADTNVPEDSRPLCEKCGYSLRGLAKNRCPECGQAFDPNDALTFRTRLQPRTILWRLDTPPGRLSYGFAVLFLAIIWYAASVPGDRLGGFFFLFTAFFTSLALGVRSIISWRRISADSVLINRRKVIRYLGIPGIIAFAILSLYLELPLYSSFFISLPEMNRVVQLCANSATKPPKPRRIGVYHVSRFEITPWGMRFVVSHSRFGDSEGFAFSPSGPPPNLSMTIYRHFFGPWYRWKEFF